MAEDATNQDARCCSTMQVGKGRTQGDHYGWRLGSPPATTVSTGHAEEKLPNPSQNSFVPNTVKNFTNRAMTDIACRARHERDVCCNHRSPSRGRPMQLTWSETSCISQDLELHRALPAITLNEPLAGKS